MPQPKTKTRPPTRGAKNRSTGLVEPQSVIPSPSKPLLPKGVAKARLKHQFDLIPPPSLSTASPCPTLGDRFFALPIELRNKIYELLIVSPPRWAVEHLPTCSAPPSWDLAHEAPFSLSCLRCRRYHRRWDPIPWKLNPYHGKDGPLKRYVPTLFGSVVSVTYLFLSMSRPCVVVDREPDLSPAPGARPEETPTSATIATPKTSDPNPTHLSKTFPASATAAQTSTSSSATNKSPPKPVKPSGPQTPSASATTCL